MLRGVLDLCLLAVVIDEPAYGYEMTRRLRERGLSTVGEGSIYPLLGRLERDGLVATHRAASDGGPPRKYYRASPSGRRALTEGVRAWHDDPWRGRLGPGDDRIGGAVMPAFIEECRYEWKRLGVPDSMADEMATELEADLAEAEADGVSAAEILGESDPRRFAATWATERGLVSRAAAAEEPKALALGRRRSCRPRFLRPVPGVRADRKRLRLDQHGSRHADSGHAAAASQCPERHRDEGLQGGASRGAVRCRRLAHRRAPARLHLRPGRRRPVAGGARRPTRRPPGHREAAARPELDARSARRRRRRRWRRNPRRPSPASARAADRDPAEPR